MLSTMSSTVSIAPVSRETIPAMEVLAAPAAARPQTASARAPRPIANPILIAAPSPAPLGPAFTRPPAAGIQLAQATGQAPPSAADPQARARQEIRRLAEELVLVQGATTHRHAWEIGRLAREFPQLADEALPLLARAFEHNPLETWSPVIGVMQELAVASDPLSAAAHSAMLTPLTIAEHGLGSGNAATRQRAVSAAEEIARSFPSFSQRVFGDLLPLLRSVDPYAPELARSVQTALIGLLRDNPTRIDQLYRGLKDRLETALAQHASADPTNRPTNQRFSLQALINDTAGSYAAVAMQASEAQGSEALQLLERVLDQVPGTNRRGALSAMAAIGARHPALARRAMEQVLARGAQDHATTSECLLTLVQSNPDLAADVAHYYSARLASTPNKQQARRELLTLIARQPATATSVIADMEAMFDGPNAGEAVRTLCDVAWSMGNLRAQILADLAKAQSRGVAGFDSASVWTSLVALAEARVPQRPVVRGMLQVYLQRLAADPTGNAETIAQAERWLARLP